MSSVWDSYSNRMDIYGHNQRDTALQREQKMLTRKVPRSLSYQTLTIDDISREVAVINSDNLNEKTIISMPGEDIPHGGLVYWMNNHWLVTERDANETVYVRAKMIQCNYLVKWVDNDNHIHEQWCIIEDGTKYLTGEYEDRNFIVTRGDSRIAMTIARNEHTAKLGRENRFIIDDPESHQPLAYLLTKPLKLGWSFNRAGVYKFVLQEVVTTDNDDLVNYIADYYKHFPKREEDVVHKDPKPLPGNPVLDPAPDEPQTPKPPTETDSGKKVWL